MESHQFKKLEPGLFLTKLNYSQIDQKKLLLY